MGALTARGVLSGPGGKPFDTVLQVVKKQRMEHQAHVPFVSVLHVDELGGVDWLQASQYCPATPGIVAHPGRMVVSLLDPAKFRAAVMPEEFPEIHCSEEFEVYVDDHHPLRRPRPIAGSTVRARFALWAEVRPVLVDVSRAKMCLV